MHGMVHIVGMISKILFQNLEDWIIESEVWRNEESENSGQKKWISIVWLCEQNRKWRLNMKTGLSHAKNMKVRGGRGEGRGGGGEDKKGKG